MIDKTQLTEALARYDGPWEALSEAARILLAFPTDEQVETLWEASPLLPSRDHARQALETVRRSMIGDD